MFCVGYGIYTRERSVYFITNTKHCITYLALPQLFSVLIIHPEMYTLFSILLHFVWESLISILAMDAFTWDKWISLAAFLLDFFSKLSGKHFIYHTLQTYMLISPQLFVHSTMILKQWRHLDQRVYLCTIWSCCLSKSILGQGV